MNEEIETSRGYEVIGPNMNGEIMLASYNGGSIGLAIWLNREDAEKIFKRFAPF